MSLLSLPILGSITGGLAVLACGAAAAQGRAPLAGMVEDVVVTARYRPEPLQETPLAIEVLTAPRLREMRPVQLSDLAGAVPGFSIEKRPESTRC